MNNKVLTTVCIAVAIVAASISAIVVTNNRATIARKQAENAEAQEETARHDAKKAQEERLAADAHAAAKKAEQKAAADNLKAKDLERIAAQADEKTASAEREKAKFEAEKSRDDASVAAKKLEEQKSKEATAKAELDKLREATNAQLEMSNAVARAEMAKLETEKLKAEKILAEAKLLEDRKIDFETWQARLLELEQELAERERALTPDISINDSTNIVWVGEREADVIGGDTNAIARLKRKKVPVESDLTLPEATRKLAHQERLMREEVAGGLSSASNKVIKSLTRLYVQAVRDGRVTDAQFYRQSIKHYYPNWEYKKP